MILLLALAIGQSAVATPPCAAMDQSLPAPLAGWRSPIPIAGSNLVVGTASQVRLATDPRFAVTSSRGAEAGTFGSAFSFRIETGGSYEILVSQGTWIDVVAAGSPLQSTAHGHGPACSTIRKTITYRLEPGSYGLQVSGSRQSEVVIAIEPAGGG